VFSSLWLAIFLLKEMKFCDKDMQKKIISQLYESFLGVVFSLFIIFASHSSHY